jgi:hypothetical protein
MNCMITASTNASATAAKATPRMNATARTRRFPRKAVGSTHDDLVMAFALGVIEGGASTKMPGYTPDPARHAADVHGDAALPPGGLFSTREDRLFGTTPWDGPGLWRY